MNSRSNADIQHLQKLMIELANLRNEPDAIKRFMGKFQRDFPEGSLTMTEQEQRPRIAATGPVFPADPADSLLVENVLAMQGWLRDAWGHVDARRKEWKLFRLRIKFHEFLAPNIPAIDEPPPESAIDDAVSRLPKIADRLRYCANPSCVTPYFIAKHGAQRFCSDACSRFAQSEYKKSWWAENKDKISKRRKREYKQQKQRE